MNKIADNRKSALMITMRLVTIFRQLQVKNIFIVICLYPINFGLSGVHHYVYF